MKFDGAELVAPGLLTSTQALQALPLGESWRVQTVNLHHLALAKHDAEFRDALEKASYRTADGWPVVALMRSTGVNAERVTGSDWLRNAVGSGQLRTHRVALIGGTPESRDKFADLLGAALVFSEVGNKSDWEPLTVVDSLHKFDVDVCIVAVTPPFGDIFAEKLAAAGFSGSLIAVGGSVDMLVGIQHRAPRMAQVLRIEWLWRMARSPRRLARRYLVDCLPTYFSSVLPQTAGNAWRSKWNRQ